MWIHLQKPHRLQKLRATPASCRFSPARSKREWQLGPAPFIARHKRLISPHTPASHSDTPAQPSLHLYEKTTEAINGATSPTSSTPDIVHPATHVHSSQVVSSSSAQEAVALTHAHSSADPPADSSADSSADSLADSSVATEAKTLVLLAGPICLQNVFGISLSMIVNAFMGQLLGAEQLACAVLASSVYNVTGLSLVMGLCAGMESLCGQAFGAKNYRFLGLVLQRAVLICWCLTIPVLLLFQYSPALLGALKQDPVVAAGAARYLQLIGPCLFLHGAAECMRKYLLTQQIVRPSMIISGLVTLLAPCYCWLFISKMSLGLEGGALAYFCCHLTACLGMLAFICFYHRKLRGQPTHPWPGISWACLRDWPQYLSYGIPATVMICMEWWAFEVLILMAGRLPTAVEAVAVMGVCFSISSFLYMVPLGLGSALNARISMFLGAGQGHMARQTLLIALGLVGVFQSALAAFVWLKGTHVFGIFTSDPGVIALASLCLPVVAIMCFSDGMNTVLSSALRGAGRPSLGALVNVVVYWAIGVPLSWYLGFGLGWGVQGFWMGITLAALIQIVWLALAIGRWDWGQLVREVQLKMKMAV